ncbi:MAG: hypothetical protein HYX69_20795 [Planctomycetia bacterium]|nr:hypothetical protein [Planctomycetia bacterium]
MERSTRRLLCVTLVSLLVAAIAATQSGCVSALASAMWIVRGNDVSADYNGLRGKRVAVVCRPLVELQYSTGSRAAQDLCSELGRLLRQRVRWITIVDPREVTQWTDEHDYDDLTEVGRALKADMVVGIDMEEFGLYQSQTLYQGKARLNITVYDIASGGDVVYQKSLPRMLYPPNRGVDTSMPEDDFRRRFVAHLADTIGRHFYSHDSHADFALDSKAFEEE